MLPIRESEWARTFFESGVDDCPSPLKDARWKGQTFGLFLEEALPGKGTHGPPEGLDYKSHPPVPKEALQGFGEWDPQAPKGPKGPPLWCKRTLKQRWLFSKLGFHLLHLL